MINKKTTIAVYEQDKHNFKKICLKYKSKQDKMFGIIMKVMKDFKPELKEEVKK